MPVKTFDVHRLIPFGKLRSRGAAMGERLLRRGGGDTRVGGTSEHLTLPPSGRRRVWPVIYCFRSFREDSVMPSGGTHRMVTHAPEWRRPADIYIVLTDVYDVSSTLEQFCAGG
ncbi:hypothetical protein GCM10009757_46970 [Streptomyces cheonanensis]|uniref:Uncharacterized protein n=1 Tax=Streptomyces cheonanensis TaxID=312720 RepID=A0ABN2VHP1_9ACTN